MRNYLVENPFFSEDLKYFARQQPIWGGIILNDNSPLTEPLNIAVMKLRERAVIDQLIKKWIGPKLRSRSQVDTMVLGAGQVIMLILVMGAAVVAAILVYCVEYTYTFSMKR